MTRPHLVRWGSSPYETGGALARERHILEQAGLRCTYLRQGDPLRGVDDAKILVVTSLTRVGAGELDSLRACRLLLTTTSGYDHLDLESARARGVTAARMPLARRDAVVEAALAMMLSLSRDLPWLQGEARRGRWARSSLPQRGIRRLTDEPVGVVGLGVIGSRMVALLRAMGVEVWGCDPAVNLPGVPNISLERMVAECRVVTLHASHLRGRPPILGEEILERARPELIVINTARGGVLDLDAAWRALQEGRLGGLGLDVFPCEPWPGCAELAAHPRVLVTPHAAGYHDKLGEAIAGELHRAVTCWLQGQEIPYRIE